MKLTIKVSNVVETRVDKNDASIDGRFYLKPVNKRGMEELTTIEAEKEADFEKELRKYLKGCCVKPQSRTNRFISPVVEKPKRKKGEKKAKEEKEKQVVYQLTLDSYKELAPYLRKFGYIV